MDCSRRMTTKLSISFVSDITAAPIVIGIAMMTSVFSSSRSVRTCGSKSENFDTSRTRLRRTAI